MEIKKIIEKRIVKIMIPISIILLILSFFILPFIGDVTQYKRIGSTEYYLVESMGSKSHANIHYCRNAKISFGESIKYKGYVKDIFWNEDYIIVKCTDKGFREIINYCIIRQHSDNKRNVPWEVYEYATKQEYEKAKKLFNLDEGLMEYTNADIPWSLHIFE